MNRILKSGIIYTAIGKYSVVVIQLILNVVLSRLLSPKEYGVVAVVQVFLLFFTTLVDAGLGPAIIQNKNLTEADYTVLFRYSIFFSLLLVIIFSSLGPFIAFFYKDKIYISLTIAMSSTLFFQGINMVPNAILYKRKMFKTVNIRLVISNICGCFIGICAAVIGLGAFALILSFTFPAIISFCMNVAILHIHPSARFDRRSLDKVWNFAKNQFLFNFINYFSRNVDQILVGKFIGPAALANYQKAYQLLLMPSQILIGIINPVLLPILSDYQDNVLYIRKFYYKIIHLLALIGIPLSVFLSFESRDVIYLLFGNQWGDAILPFSILASTIWIQLTISSTGSIFQALGQSRLLFLNGCLSACILISSIIIGLLGRSIVSVSVFLSIGFLINFIVIFYIMIKKTLAGSIFDFIKEFYSPLLLGLFIFVSMLLSKFIVNDYPFIADFIINCFIFVIISILFLYFSGEYNTIITFLKREDINE